MLHIQLLGRFGVWRDGRAVPIPPRSVQELLCFLLLSRRDLPREVVASELWGDRSTAQSLKQLSQALWLMKGVFEEEGLAELRVADPEFPRLERSGDVSLDTDGLGQAYLLATRGARPAPPDLAELHRAAACQGDLLEGWNQEWCLAERERCRDRLLVVLDRLVEISLHDHELQAGLEYARRILALEPARERTHRQVMELHLLSGDRTGALRQFERCAGLLRAEFGVEPGAETRAVWQRARTGEEPPAAAPALSDALQTVDQVAHLLLEVKRKLEALR